MNQSHEPISSNLLRYKRHAQDEEWLNDIAHYKVPTSIHCDAATHFNVRVARISSTLKHIMNFNAHMWLPVDMEWTEKLAPHLRGMKVLEIFAGRGWLSQAFFRHGVDITATDIEPLLPEAHPVVRMDALEAVNHYKPEALVISYPPKHLDVAAQAFEAFRDGGGKKVLHFGDSDFTANERYHQLLSEYDNTNLHIPCLSWDFLASDNGQLIDIQ